MLRPLNNDVTTTVVFPGDEAFELPAEEGELRDVYRKLALNPTRWKELLTVKDGHVPTEFVIGAVPPAVLSRLEDQCGKGFHASSEFQWCMFLWIRDVKNFGKDKVPKLDTYGIERIDPEWASKTFVGPLFGVAKSIGYALWRWNQLTEDEVKNS